LKKGTWIPALRFWRIYPRKSRGDERSECEQRNLHEISRL